MKVKLKRWPTKRFFVQIAPFQYVTFRPFQDGCFQ